MGTPLADTETEQRPALGALDGYAVIAYRWGWLNNGHYIVRVTSDLQSARDAADAEASHRGGKYGVTVWDTEGRAMYHAPSLYGEKQAHTNERIEMFERVGQRVAVALENEKPLSPADIKECWEQERAHEEFMCRLHAKHNAEGQHHE